MNCPNCNFEISEVDKTCPFCEYIISKEESIDIPETNDDITASEDVVLVEPQLDNSNCFSEHTSDNQATNKEDQSALFNEITTDTDILSNDIPKVSSGDNDMFLETTKTVISVNVEQEHKVTEKAIDATEELSLDSEHNVPLIEKFLIAMSHSKKLDTDAVKNTLSKKSHIQNIISSIPFMFWYPYALRKKTKNMIFFANQSLKLMLYLMINCIALLFFELMPFYKTVTYLNDGILFYSSVKYIPLVILIPLSISFFIWFFLTFLNIYCSVKNKPYNFLPFKHLSIIK